MMIKKYIYILTCIGLMSSCGDGFLDSELLTAKTDGNFYKTPEDASLALIGCYDGLQQVWNGGISFPLAAEVFSDNCYGGTGASDGFNYRMIDEFNKEVSPADVNVFESNWSGYYRTIFRANKLLLALDNIDWTGQESKRNQIEGETKFIRGLCYFHMVRFFGNIPLLETPSVDNLPQADPVEVYKLVASDLSFATQNLAANPYTSSYAASNDGRATKWAAQSMLARVFLYYTGYYGQSDLPTQSGSISKTAVVEMLDDLIANSGHDLVEDYNTLWPAASVDAYAGEGNIESIFSIKYTYTSDYNGNSDGNHWMVMFGMRQTDAFPYGRGWGGATVTPKLYDAFSADDTRRLASIIAIDDEGIELDNTSQREYTGYYVKKYAPMSTSSGQSVAENLGGVNFQIGQFQDFVVMRFADVLLMAAELGSASAQEHFDKVRRRANPDGFTPLNVSLANIYKERQLELAFEGLRYWDLLRRGLDVAAQEINVSGATVYSGGVEETKNVTFNQATQGLQQIPSNQINLSNGTLVQNAGW